MCIVVLCLCLSAVGTSGGVAVNDGRLLSVATSACKGDYDPMARLVLELSREIQSLRLQLAAKSAAGGNRDGHTRKLKHRIGTPTALVSALVYVMHGYS